MSDVRDALKVPQHATKGLVAYRVGQGLPGYLGFCPVSEEIPIPAKGGCSVRAKLGEGGIHASNAKPGDGGTVKPPETTAKEDFQLTPQQFAQGTAPNGLWDIKGVRPIGDPPYIQRPPSTADSHVFFASSTFRDTIDKGQDKKWYPDAVTRLGQLRPPSQQAPPVKPNPFFVTEYSQKSAQVNIGTKLPVPPRWERKVRANPDIAGVTLRDRPLTTSYRNDYGAFGVNPASKTAADPSQLKFNSSTAENAVGTTKCTYHLPGYCGFIPEARINAQAVQHSAAVAPRVRRNYEMSTLFQYPQNIPGYAGYRPITTANDVGPQFFNEMTTTGRHLNSGSCGFEPGDLGLSMQTLAPTAPQRSVHGRFSSLRHDLFTHESQNGAISDNGQHDAEQYYASTRPFEGRSVAIIKQGHWSSGP